MDLGREEREGAKSRVGDNGDEGDGVSSHGCECVSDEDLFKGEEEEVDGDKVDTGPG